MIKVNIKNCWKIIKDKNELFLLKIIEKALNEEVKISGIKEADLVLLYNFSKHKFIFKTLNRWIKSSDNDKNNFNLFFGIPKNKKILAVSHENLDSVYWNWFGQLLIKYNIHRLTSWPEIVDPGGCQFPYWYDFIKYEEFSMPEEYYSRFGEPLSAEKLVNPLRGDNGSRKDAVCVMAGHLRFPRNNVIENLKKIKPVDIYGSAGQKWEGSKFELLKQYKYCFCAENSLGYGYETEKVPEAWHAGCIPVGYFQTCPSNFNPEVLSIFFENEKNAYGKPLLYAKPSLNQIFSYIKKIFY